MITKDPIYRFINVPELCRKFVDTPEFQRLRNIKQLGLVEFVYVSATHTRFEHSLGVMHLAGVVIDQLKEHGQKISEREKEIVQLAGLLHDIGHIAFSHLFDYMLEENGIHFLHEDRSVVLLKNINKRLQLLSEKEVEMISDMIYGNIDEKKTDKPFLYEIVSNKAFGIDVDRLDYLQRDSYHTGMPSFQPDYLVKCLRVMNGRLAVLEKARPEVEMLYETRKRLLTLVCRHKTILDIELLIREGIYRLLYIKNWEEIRWEDIDDIEVWYRLRKECPDIINQIETRIWNKNQKIDRFTHITCISKKSILERIESVRWC